MGAPSAGSTSAPVRSAAGCCWTSCCGLFVLLGWERRDPRQACGDPSAGVRLSLLAWVARCAVVVVGGGLGSTCRLRATAAGEAPRGRDVRCGGTSTGCSTRCRPCPIARRSLHQGRPGPVAKHAGRAGGEAAIIIIAGLALFLSGSALPRSGQGLAALSGVVLALTVVGACAAFGRGHGPRLPLASIVLVCALATWLGRKRR